MTMPWCPNCGTEYEPGVAQCADCGATLVDQPPAGPGDPNEPTVVVLEARSVTEAQVAEATLEAEGIDAYVQTTTSPSLNVGVMGDDVPELEVVVAADDAERAEQILREPPVTDEELAQLAESDTNGDAEGVV
jgi:hypothetical protein